MNLRDEIMVILARHMPAETTAEHMAQVADELIGKMRADAAGRLANTTLEHLRDSPSSGELAQQAADHLASQAENAP